MASESTRHTSGPWRYEKVRSGPYIASYLVSDDSCRGLMAIETDLFDEIPEAVHEANVRLAVSAPELLAACEAISDRIGKEPDITEDQRVIGMVLAAIRRAKGE